MESADTYTDYWFCYHFHGLRYFGGQNQNSWLNFVKKMMKKDETIARF
jgi:hypothetical protein